MRMFVKMVAVAAATLIIAPTLVEPADAGGVRKKRQRVVQYQPPGETVARSYRNPMAENGYTGYYENILSNVPFGSQVWWRVYDSYPKGR
jgi:hypothetical protein